MTAEISLKYAGEDHRDMPNIRECGVHQSSKLVLSPVTIRQLVLERIQNPSRAMCDVDGAYS